MQCWESVKYHDPAQKIEINDTGDSSGSVINVVEKTQDAVASSSQSPLYHLHLRNLHQVQVVGVMIGVQEVPAVDPVVLVVQQAVPVVLISVRTRS